MGNALDQVAIDFPALLAELASGDCWFCGFSEMARWDALRAVMDCSVPAALGVRVWVSSLDARLLVRVPPSCSNRVALGGLQLGDRVAFGSPSERSYLDYPADTLFEAIMQHQLYALSLHRPEGVS